MNYLSIFDSCSIQLNAGATWRDEQLMMFGKALFLSTPGDEIAFSIKTGRQIGIIFFRHDWSGKVCISIGERRVELDLYSPIGVYWVAEFSVPTLSHGLKIKMRLLDRKNSASKGTEAWVQAIYTSDYRTSEIPHLILQCVEEPPFTLAALNQLIDVSKWYEPLWQTAMKFVAPVPAYIPPDFVHRKPWEWVQCAFGLDWLGSLHPDSKGLGVGVGWEPLPFFFSNHVREVVATDLYATGNQWSEMGAKEGDPAILENPEIHATMPYRSDRLTFRCMDGRKLDFPDASFDFVWSCSSIEHFGGHKGATQSMKEIERVLQPGGIAAIITEYVLPDPATGTPSLFDPEYFNLRCLYEYIISPVQDLKLVQMIDTTIPEYYVQHACQLPDEADAPHKGINKPHIVLKSPSGALHTSIALFFQKVGGLTPTVGPRIFAYSE